MSSRLFQWHSLLLCIIITPQLIYRIYSLSGARQRETGERWGRALVVIIHRDRHVQYRGIDMKTIRTMSPEFCLAEWLPASAVASDIYILYPGCCSGVYLFIRSFCRRHNTTRQAGGAAGEMTFISVTCWEWECHRDDGSGGRNSSP